MQPHLATAAVRLLMSPDDPKTIQVSESFQFRFIAKDLEALIDAMVPDEVIKAMAARTNGVTQQDP